jgi:hypothetical protein
VEIGSQASKEAGGMDIQELLLQQIQQMTVLANQVRTLSKENIKKQSSRATSGASMDVVPPRREEVVVRELPQPGQELQGEVERLKNELRAARMLRPDNMEDASTRRKQGRSAILRQMKASQAHAGKLGISDEQLEDVFDLMGAKHQVPGNGTIPFLSNLWASELGEDPLLALLKKSVVSAKSPAAANWFQLDAALRRAAMLNEEEGNERMAKDITGHHANTKDVYRTYGWSAAKKYHFEAVRAYQLGERALAYHHPMALSRIAQEFQALPAQIESVKRKNK